MAGSNYIYQFGCFFWGGVSKRCFLKFLPVPGRPKFRVDQVVDHSREINVFRAYAHLTQLAIIARWQKKTSDASVAYERLAQDEREQFEDLAEFMRWRG